MSTTSNAQHQQHLNVNVKWKSLKATMVKYPLNKLKTTKKLALKLPKNDSLKHQMLQNVNTKIVNHPL